MDPAAPAPRFSLVIPAYNEERYLPRLLDSVDESRARYRGGPGAVEVIVADNASTDATARIAADRGCRVARVEQRRIACARNGGAALARGAILCFVDADFRIHPETFNVIEREMTTGRFVGGATGVVPERSSPAIALTIWLLLPMLWLFGLDGGVWYCRREDFHAVGGYDERQEISEDVRFLLALRRLGRGRRPRQRLTRGRSTGPPAKAVVSLRKFDKHGDWHFLRAMVRLPLLQVFAPRRFQAEVRAYWYEDR